MNLPKNYFKLSVGLLVAVAITVVFSLRSFAAPDVATYLVDPVLAQDCTGTLTVKNGSVSVNGNTVQTGATVISGNIIATSTGGTAIIDFGALGRVEIGEGTAVTLTCTGNTITVRANCRKTEVEVRRGQVTAGNEVIPAGKEKDIDGQVDVTATQGSDFKVECEGNKGGGGLWKGPGLLGLLALIGVGAGVAIGIAVGDEDSSSAAPPVSPARP